MRSFVAASALLAAAMLPVSSLPAQQTSHDPAPTPVPAASVDRPARPHLIIAIAVDQFSADLFAEYRPLFRGGFARLAGGAVFPSGFQAHGATETCPGHSTILTGDLPYRTGIIANNWIDQSVARDDKRVYCAEDPTVAGTSSASGQYSPSVGYLRVPTLGDLMKRADPRTRVVAVSGKDRAAIMMGGHDADAIIWMTPTGFASFRGVPLADDVVRINTAVATNLARARPALDVPQQCASRDRAVDVGGGHSVGTGHLDRAAGDYRHFLASPEVDGVTLAAAAALRATRHLGEGPQTDLLAISLSATDYVGHTYGTEGVEMCLQLTAIDRELGDFLDRMDATGVDYVVTLTADHGGHDLPERNREDALPVASRLDRGVSATAVSERLRADLHITTPGPLLLADGPFGDYYISRALSAADRARVTDAAVRMLSAFPQVDHVYRGSEVAATPVSTRSPEQWSVLERLRASYDAARSGDLLVVLRDRVTPIPDGSSGYVATHGSVWDYDRRVPILFWRRGMVPFEQPNPVRTIDIMPTLAALIGLPIAAGSIDGRCLDLIAGAGDSCRAR